MNYFSNKENLKPAERKSREKANLYDGFIFLLVMLFAVSLDELPYYLKILVVVAYVFIVFPLMLANGGSLGHLLSSLRVRKFNDYEKNISIGEAYFRLFFLFTNFWVWILGFSKKNKYLFEKASNTQTVELDLSNSSEDNSIIEKQIRIRKFIIYSIIYLAWVVWLGNFWFIFGLGILFDMHVSKKVNWSPWKKRDGKNNILIEWFDALIFAVVAVTIINIFLFQNYKIPTGSMEKSLQINDHLYVSKVAYGPRIPNTPLSLPFMQHTIPGRSQKKSYLDWIQWDYKRLKGFSKIERWDPVVFNFPAGDTVCIENQVASYYSIVRDRMEYHKRIDESSRKALRSDEAYYSQARKDVWDNFNITIRPVDKSDNYIKRCVAIPGDSLQIINGTIYINGEKEPDTPGVQHAYDIYTNGKPLNKRALNKLGIYSDDLRSGSSHGYSNVPLTSEMKKEIEGYKNVIKILPSDSRRLTALYNIFPHSDLYDWDLENFGPIYIPQKGATVEINMKTLPFYKRIIGHYEKNKLEVKDSTIYINDKVATNYTFKMDYYWMMGDNRNRSSDARYWGYVPEDHIIGRPRFIWLSMHKEKSFPMNIRLRRMFKVIR